VVQNARIRLTTEGTEFFNKATVRDCHRHSDFRAQQARAPPAQIGEGPLFRSVIERIPLSAFSVFSVPSVVKCQIRSG
jgi:hypothetical protein